jgi:hypothetical protein
MRRAFIVWGIIILVQLCALPALAQDQLSGKWEGTLQSPQGEQPTTATFKKEGDAYTGAISGMRGEMPLKNIKVEGEKITAQAQVETAQGSFTINYTFTLQGDTLKGKGELDFGGQSFTFDVNLKRVGGAAAPSAAAPAQQPQPQQQPARQRRDVPQPQQQQSAQYFVGQWSFKWIGRESLLSPGPREGTLTFKLRADGKTLDGRSEAKTDEGAFTETIVITFDGATKQLTFSEQRSNGVKITSTGDWSSPISINCKVDPVKVKGQTLQIKRTFSIIGPHSFSITEELSENGGPFVRLGNGLFTRVETKN